MNGLATSRQQISAKQRLPRNTRTQSYRVVASHVVNATFQLSEIEAARGRVQMCHASCDFRKGSLVVREHEAYFLVESGVFDGYFYVVTTKGNKWVCSASDERVAGRCIAQVLRRVEVAA